MTSRLHEWIACPTCESTATGLLAYGGSLSLECYDCGTVDEFELGEPPLHEFGPDRTRGESRR